MIYLAAAALVVLVIVALGLFRDDLLSAAGRRRKRRVKLHLSGGQPSVEGIQDGRTVDGYYLILAPKLHHSASEPPLELKNPVEVKVSQVVMVERLA